MKIALLLLAAVLAIQANAQNWPLKQAVESRKKSGQVFTPFEAFKQTAKKSLPGGGTYRELQLNSAFKARILLEQPETMQINVPVSDAEQISCELVKVSLGNIKFTENNQQLVQGIKTPVLYRGIITGEQQKNSVVFTLTDESVSLMAVYGNKAVQITKADEQAPGTYRLYNSAEITFPSPKVNCGTKDGPDPAALRGFKLDGSSPPFQNNVQDKCVNVFVECFDSLYQWQSSSRQKTINYVYELFNLVGAGYANDSVNIQLIGINVWTTMDPYRQPNREIALSDLGEYYKDNFWGNICVGLDYGKTPRFGLAWRARAKAITPNQCPTYSSTDSSGAFAYCDQNYFGNYQNFPTGPNVTADQLYQVMHEMGHQLGSKHTQWCGWLLSGNPNVYGAIDNCATVEPNGKDTCKPGPPPVNGGTIMSYCNGAPAYINYNNGFGPLPGKVIRNFVANNTCIPVCEVCLEGNNLHGKTALPEPATASTKQPPSVGLQAAPGALFKIQPLPLQARK